MRYKNYYILDANSVYEFFGREKLNLGKGNVNRNKIVRFLYKKNICITSSVLTELITHFYNDSDKLESLLNFLRRKDVKLLSVGPDIYYNFFPDYYLNLTEKQKNKEKQKILNNKIKIESQFLSFLTYAQTILYCKCLLKKILNRNDLNQAAYFFITEVAKEYQLKAIELFQNELQANYFESDAKKAAKKVYSNVLSTYVYLANVFYEAIKNGQKFGQTVNKEDMLNNIIPKVKSLKLSSNKNLIAEITKVCKANKQYFEEQIKGVEHRLKEERYTDIQCFYYVERIKKLVYSGGFPNKNDIYDVLFIGALGDESLGVIKKIDKSIKTIKQLKIVTFDVYLENIISSYNKNNLVNCDRFINK